MHSDYTAYTILFNLYTIIHTAYTVLLNLYTTRYTAYTILLNLYTIRYTTYTTLLDLFINLQIIHNLSLNNIPEYIYQTLITDS